ncbi:hypothetical protein IWX78_002395 [Mycetocola sp. CAN_C7]|uniref:hypothetical protein n=1 Tax=Mycetocola sp. CAN_C7 TaxID=2787724 RepID=UPI0018C8D78B
MSYQDDNGTDCLETCAVIPDWMFVLDDNVTPIASVPRSTEAQGLSAEDRQLFQAQWDDFAAHID